MLCFRSSVKIIRVDVRNDADVESIDRCDPSAVSVLGGLVGEIPGGSSLFGLVNVFCA
jgi:hypothetical protein